MVNCGRRQLGCLLKAFGAANGSILVTFAEIITLVITVLSISREESVRCLSYHFENVQWRLLSQAHFTSPLLFFHHCLLLYPLLLFFAIIFFLLLYISLRRPLCLLLPPPILFHSCREPQAALSQKAECVTSSPCAASSALNNLLKRKRARLRLIILSDNLAAKVPFCSPARALFFLALPLFLPGSCL